VAPYSGWPPKRAGRAWPVLDHHGLAEALSHLLAEQPRHGVDAAAGRERDDDLDRARRIILGERPGHGRKCERKGKTAQRYPLAPCGKTH